MEERKKVIDRIKEGEWVPAKRRRNAVNVALRHRLHKDVHRFTVSFHKRRFQKICNMTETNDEARVSKIANDETINNNLDMSIYENVFDKCYRFIDAIDTVPAGTKTNDYNHITLFNDIFLHINSVKYHTRGIYYLCTYPDRNLERSWTYALSQIYGRTC